MQTVTELFLSPIQAVVGNYRYERFKLIVDGGRARLVNGSKVAVLDEEATVERVEDRKWEVRTTAGTVWTVTDARGCACHGSQVVPIR